jgi:hypothetical protein
MKVLGLDSTDWSRRTAMAPDISVQVRQSKATAFRRALEGLHIDGSPVTCDQREQGFFSISLGHRNVSLDFGELGGRRVLFRDLGLRNLTIEDESNSSAYHVPEGVLLIFDPARSADAETRRRIDTTEIAPAILSSFGLVLPSYMREPSFMS